MMFVSVFLTSLSSIAFEILLARIFSISQWHHLSFMVISIALFGMAASGTYVCIAESRGKKWWMRRYQGRWVVRLSIFYTVSTLLSYILVTNLPLDYYKLPVQAMQALYLMIAYLSLAVPFYVTGLIISQAYISIPEKAGRIYFVNMAGSALGALIPMVLLKLLGEGKAITLVAVLPLLICFSFLRRSDRTCHKSISSSKRPSSALVWMGSSLFSLCLISILFFHPSTPPFKIPLSTYKALHQLCQFPDSRIVSSTTGIRGRIDTVHSPYIRFSPGLSLQYTGTLPQQSALFKDGDGRLVLYHVSNQDDLLFASYSLPYAGYLMAPKNTNVLIIQDGGGSAIPCAISSGAREITVIEKHPRFAEMIRHHYQITAVSQSPALYLAGESKRFDIIHLEDWGSSLPGTAALNMNHLLTIESLTSYLEHLSDDGLLICSRKLILPPSNVVRIASTAHEALDALQVAAPRNHIAILRNWDTFTFLLSKRKIQDLDILETFASDKNFDMIWPQGEGAIGVNHFNKFEKPYYADAIQSLFTAFSDGRESIFFRDYPLDIAPQTDNRPFPDKFFKWRKARTIHRITGSRLYTLLLSGEIIIAIVFIEAMIIAGLLLLAPLWFVGKQTSKPSLLTMAYFTGIGAGFILVEIYFIHYYTRIFNDPVLSFSMVLAAVLISSSIGGLISQRLRPEHLKGMLVFVGFLLFLMFFCSDPLIETIIRLPSHLCMIFAPLLIIPVGIPLGFPFPMGMRYLMAQPAHRAYAWAANGSASVLAAVVAAQVSISWGLTSLLGCAVLAYGMSGLALLGYKGLRSGGSDA